MKSLNTPDLSPPGRALLQVLIASLPLIYLLLLAWLLIGPLWSQPGLPDTADGTLHLHRSAAVVRSWSSGVLWPRWFPDIYQELGAPTFHYYSPLFYLSVAPLHLAGLPLDLAVKLLITGGFVLSGLAAWAWLRLLLDSSAAGLAGATLYLAQAHLFREYYFQGGYPQLLALFLLPAVLWAFTELYLRDGWLGRLAAPLSLALFIAAHNISAMLGAAALAFHSLFLLLWKRNWTGWLRLVVGAGCGLGLSAFFWLPALGDTGLVRVENLQAGFFHFAQYFVPGRDLLAAPPLFDGRAANPPFPHMLGWAAWLVLVAGGLVLALGLVRRSGRTAGWFWAVSGLLFVAVCLFLTQPASTILWEDVPLLALAEFPSRWLGPAGLGVALVGGAVVSAGGRRWSWLLLLALILVVALGSGTLLFPHQPFRPVDGYTARETRSYELRSYAWGLTSGNEFLPRWAGQTQPEAGRLARRQYLPADADWSWQTAHRAVLRPAPGSALAEGALVLPVHYFPAWRVLADGVLVSREPTEDGLLRVDLPQPARKVVLLWQGTTWQRVGEWVSLLALLSLSWWVGLAFKRGSLRKRSPESGRTLRPVASQDGISEPAGRRVGYWGLAPILLLVVLILAHGAIRVSGLGWFQRSSLPDQVIGVANPLYVDLGGEEQPGVTLLGWELLSSSPRPGSQVVLRLYWQRQAKIDEALHSFAFVYTPSLQRAWAAVQNYNPGRIPTNRWSPALYYVDDLVIQLPIDLAPATYTLAVGMVDAETHRLQVQDTSDDLVLLETIAVQPLKADWRQPLRPEMPVRAVFDGRLQLQGYDLLPDPGGPILRLYWEVLETPPVELVTFVHLIDADGQMLAQFDGPPLAGLLPTSEWSSGSLLIDRRKLDLPEDLMAGEPATQICYRFLIGLYERDTGNRLSVRPGPEGGAEEHFAGDALVVPLCTD